MTLKIILIKVLTTILVRSTIYLVNENHYH